MPGSLVTGFTTELRRTAGMNGRTDIIKVMGNTKWGALGS
jgi:hypothetical protein